VAENNDGRGTNEPEEGSQRRCPKEEWDSNHEQTGVEGLLGDSTVTKLEGVRTYLVHGVKSAFADYGSKVERAMTGL
jgi:hypothetical protein